MDPMTIGILIFPDVEELDVAGPLEVFGQAESQTLMRGAPGRSPNHGRCTEQCRRALVG